MQFLETLEPSSRKALEFPLLTVKLAVTVKSRANRQLPTTVNIRTEA